PFAINFFRPFRFSPLDRKKFPAHPGQLHRAVLVDALAAKVLKRVKVIPPGTKQQVPANVKTAASGNSTDDGVLKAKQRSKESHHGSTRHQ
ncbi:hypothetical protein, partial [Klebsiella michiganensis]|uniref:hypothetical protein n=1 Tax=Klebsiella michiganensis TaxID=1134687 RepID=UPI0037098F03